MLGGKEGRYRSIVQVEEQNFIRMIAYKSVVR
jgi:hypothetical protein